MRLLIQTILFLSCFQAFGAPNTDRFWQVGLGDGRVFYWRTHKAGDKTEVYDACKSGGGPLAAATTTGTSWALSGQYGNLAARIDAEGKLLLTLDGKDYGVGQRIAAPGKCEDGAPVKVKMIDVAPAERSFAAIPPILSDDTFWEADFFTYDEGRGDLCQDPIDKGKLSVFSSMYWRVQKNDNKIELHNACSDKSQAGKTYLPLPVREISESSFEIRGIVSSDYGGLFAHLEKDGKLKLTLKRPVFSNANGFNVATVKDCLYGTARRIHPVTCQDNKPVKVEEMVLETRSQNTFAGGDFLHLERAVGATLPSKRFPPPPPLAPVPPSHELLPTGETLDCQTTPVFLATSRQLQNAPILGNPTSLWPGALLQGKAFATGKFQPITIERGPGTIWLTGANFDADSALSVKVPKMEEAVAKKAIAELIGQKMKSVESSFDFSTEILYNTDQMAYDLGADGRFLHGLEKDIQIVPAPNKSYVLVRFRQSYYTASLLAPSSRYSVFADKKNFKDPNNEMGPDNPPILVGSVAYGRTIFFLVTSSYEGNAVSAALASAQENKPDGTITTAGRSVSYSQILQSSTFSGFAQGGNQAEMKNLISQVNTAANKYEAVKNILQGIKSKHVSDLSGAVPIKYSAMYLTNRSSASMGFAADYNRKDCVTTPKKYTSFTLDIFHIDDHAKITLIGPNGQEILIYEGTRAPNFFDIDNFIPDNQKDSDFTLRLQLYNVAGPSGLVFALKRVMTEPAYSHTILNRETRKMDPVPGGNLPDKYKVYGGGSWRVGWIADSQIRINRSTGAVTVIQ